MDSYLSKPFKPTKFVFHHPMMNHTGDGEGDRYDEGGDHVDHDQHGSGGDHGKGHAARPKV